MSADALRVEQVEMPDSRLDMESVLAVAIAKNSRIQIAHSQLLNQPRA
jgi:hypothetical protein